MRHRAIGKLISIEENIRRRCWLTEADVEGYVSNEYKALWCRIKQPASSRERTGGWGWQPKTAKGFSVEDPEQRVKLYDGT